MVDMRKLILLFIIIFLAPRANADTIYLKNGGSIDGIVEKEDGEKIELDTGFGSVIFTKQQVKNIEKASSEDNGKMMTRWQDKKAQLDAKAREFEEAREKRFKVASEHWKEDALRKRSNEEAEIKHIQVARDERTRSIVVEALLNEDIKASLVLDTGASLIVLTKKIGEELGVDMTDTKSNIMEFRLADGRRAAAKAIILDSVRIQDVELKKVVAAVMLDQIKDPSLRDGLLGMSFLNKFNLKIDLKNMKITLEKLKEEGAR